jgi:hypothetical protein
VNATPLTSIIIDNYNYARYLREAIDSAINQTYAKIEVVVVDDGSTDESPRVIRSYGERIVPVLKSNGGQGSAFNAGLAASRGEIVIFLDADDALLPTAVEKAVPFFADPELVKVHWPMWLTDAEGRRDGRVYPAPVLAQGDLREQVRKSGPTHQLSAPTSGNALRRSFLEQIFPLPEETYRTAADTPLIEMAPFFGKLGFVAEPLTLYRQHNKNLHTAFPLDRLIGNELRFYEHYSVALQRWLASRGFAVDPEAWRQNSWWHRQAEAVHAIGTLEHPERPIILVDDATWEPGLIHGRSRIPFLESEGAYNGPAENDEHAIEELERLRSGSAPPSHVIFAWSSFWWLDAYPRFRQYLETAYRKVLHTASAIAFDISVRRV